MNILIKSTVKAVTNHKAFLPVLFVIFAGLCGASYMSARDIMLAGNTWLYVVESNITLNFVIFLFIGGLLCDHFTKGKSKRYQWTVTIIVMVIVFMFFRFVAGYETVIG